tara:strand:- start:247 stop:1161 length:915 start_codon:yes stop_codon:yes gene_type:complete
MIKTTIVGLGNIGYHYDINNRNKRLSHYSSIIKNKNFRIVSVVEKKSKVYNSFKKKNSVPIYKNIFSAIKNHSSELLIIACNLNTKIIHQIIKKTNIKYILAEKPFLISKKKFVKLSELLKKKKIFFSLNFQRNFSSKYTKYFLDIKKGLLGNNLNFFCYYNRDFYSNATHLLNLLILSGKKLLTVKRVNSKCIYLKFSNLDAYFFNVSKKYNNNSFLIFGSKGKFEISSRPEVGKLYLKVKDRNYKGVNILKFKKKINFSQKYPQKNILNNVYKTLKKNNKPYLSLNHVALYLQYMDKIKKIV